jgi:hypothetical protein
LKAPELVSKLLDFTVEIRSKGIREIIVGAHVRKKQFGYIMLSSSKMAIAKRGGKGRGFKKNRNLEVFCLQEQ